MINLKNISARFLVINILKKVLTILGCLFFVFSFISPFYFVVFPTRGTEGMIAYYYSHKVDMHTGIGHGSSSTQYWFSDFWFQFRFGITGVLPLVFISLFTVQVLTLVFGVVSVILDRRILSFAPVLFSLTTMALMICIGWILFPLDLWMPYLTGFYLIFPSVILFVSASALNEVLKNMRFI